MKNESTEQAVSTSMEPLENDNTLWAIVDEQNCIVNVQHRSFGEMKAIFTEKKTAQSALAFSIRSAPEHVAFRVLPVEALL